MKIVFSSCAIELYFGGFQLFQASLCFEQLCVCDLKLAFGIDVVGFQWGGKCYSHSIVEGGFDEMS